MLGRLWVLVFVLGAAQLWFPTISSAQDGPKLAKECIDAKITTQAACDALLKKLGKTGHKPTDKTKGGKPANASSHVAFPKVCTDAGLKTQAECDAFQATEKAKPKTTAPTGTQPPSSAALPPATPPSTPAPSAPKQSSLPRDCVAAGISTQAACDAFHASQNTKAKSAALSPSNANGMNGKAPVVTKPNSPTLSKDCVAAGLSTQADCDALHAIEKTTAHGVPNLKSKTAGVPPTSAAVTQPTGAATPSEPNIKPLGPTLPQDCVAAGLKTQVDCDALHAMEKAKAQGSPDLKTNASTNPVSSAPVSQPATTPPTTASQSKQQIPTLPQDCVTAGLKSQADCDAYHLAKAKSGTSATPAPRIATLSAVQPKEVIPALPKNVTQAQVAPLLDSAKLAASKPTANQAAALPATPTAPPPTTDKVAQLAIAPITPPPIGKQPGTPIAPAAKAAAVQLPSNVTIVNQTIINNTTTNIVINNPAQPPPPANPIGLRIGVVLQIGGGQLLVDSAGRDQYRIADEDRDHTDYEQLSHGRYRETIVRPDGMRVVTIYDRNGDVLRRSRFDPDGREIILAYYDFADDPDIGDWRDPGDDLPPLRLQVPVEDYVLDADEADEEAIRTLFSRPPVEPLHRLYSISEVERSARLRDIVPRVELGDLTFDTGSAGLGSDQIGALSRVAHAMLALLEQNPGETFLIEGHTDAVGSDASNLVLSDARAASVARILTQAYHIPPENLATQGYGDHFLRIQTDGPERLNRRVVIRRITPLITAAAAS